MTLRDVIARLDDFRDGDTIYVDSPDPTARAVVATELDEGGVPPEAAGLTYFLEVRLAREAIHVWRAWRGGAAPTVDQQVAAVTHYAATDTYLPTD